MEWVYDEFEHPDMDETFHLVEDYDKLQNGAVGSQAVLVQEAPRGEGIQEYHIYAIGEITSKNGQPYLEAGENMPGARYDEPQALKEILTLEDSTTWIGIEAD